MKRFFRFTAKNIDDLLCLAGCGLVIYATAILSLVAALYVAGGMCIIAGVLIGASRMMRNKP